MQWDTITDQWPWFVAAGVLVVVIAALATYYFYKPNLNPHDPNQNQQGGWTPTGRIDFTDPHSIGNFILQVEETSIDESVGGVEHRAIRWRKATLDEAKKVIVAYHAHRNLTMRPTFVVTSQRMARGPSDLNIEQSSQGKLAENEGSDEQLEN